MKTTLSYWLADKEQQLMASFYPYMMPLLRKLDAETAHKLGLVSLMLGVCGGVRPWSEDSCLHVEAMGLRFPNPIGIAAGFDKNAEVIRPLVRLGFGHVEVGTVTPRPQSGNPKPRLFRLMADGAIINRMGFNNDGIDRMVVRLARNHRYDLSNHFPKVPLAVNIGINKVGADPEKDYPQQIGRVCHYADYIVMNLSSPNTPGLRDLQSPARLKQILAAINELQPKRPPLVVKLAPDLEPAEVESIVETAIEGKVQGLIMTNTTITRPTTLRSPLRDETGGLSGRPLRQKSTEMLAQVARLAKGRLTLIGCGGIESGADIVEKIMHGADYTQLYSAFAYEGPPIIRRLKKELLTILQRDGIKNIAEIKGQAL